MSEISTPPEVLETEALDSITVRTPDAVGVFKVADRIGALAMMKLAKMAQGSDNYTEFEWLAQIFTMIEQVIAADEWERFAKFCEDQRVGMDALNQVTRDALAVMSKRPTKSRSDSPSGQTETAPVWSGDSSEPESWTLDDDTSSTETGPIVEPTRVLTTEERFAQKMQAWRDREPVTAQLMSVAGAAKAAKEKRLTSV